MKAVAWSSGPGGDEVYVEDGLGDYVVLLPYKALRRGFWASGAWCLTCHATACEHCLVALKDRARS